MLEQLTADEPAAVARCLRDLVALSTLPALWIGAGPQRIAESLAAAIDTTIQPEFVFVAFEGLPGAAPVAVVQAGRHDASAALAARMLPQILSWAREHDPDELLELPHPAHAGLLRMTTRPIGHLAEAGVLGISMRDGVAPTAAQHLVLNVCATQAAVAIRNAELLHSLRRSEETARAAEQELRDAARRKDEFMATLAHELRNPLAALRNVVEVIGGRAAPAGGGRWTHDILDRQVTQLTRLVDDLLDMARINRGQMVLQLDRLELTDAISASVEACRPLLDARGHRFELQLPSEPMPVRGDATRLCQIVANLLNNAAKYTEPGGRVTLTLRRQAGEALICVRDTGIGIPADMLGRIFEMFTQADHPLTRAHGGLGIGLTLTRRLVLMHGGEIEAHSAGVGQGSEFVVRLPLLADAPVAAALPVAARATSRGRRILIADDNRDAAESLAILLRMSGHEVCLAFDGVEAVDLAQNLRPEVVLMDIGMPRLNGYQAAARLRQLPWAEAPLLVAVTGWGQPSDHERSLAAGFSHHLTKPINLEALHDLLAAAATVAGPPG